MFYAADSLSGALWEAALRHVEVGRGRFAKYPMFKLRGLVASRIQPRRADLPLLELGRPDVLALFPVGDGPEILAVNAMLATARHLETHDEIRQLH